MFNKRVLPVLLAVICGTANAQIPVTDGVHISTSIFNAVETVASWAAQYGQMVEQINQYKQQIEQYKEHYNAIRGSRGMGDLLNNSTALTTSLPPDWQDAFSSIKSTAEFATARAQYPTYAAKPKSNKLYDVVAAHSAATTQLYKKANGQIGEIKTLMGKIDSATDPAAKQDLMNRLVSQQNALQASQNLATLIETKQRQELEVASRDAAAEAACSEFKRSC